MSTGFFRSTDEAHKVVFRGSVTSMISSFLRPKDRSSRHNFEPMASDRFLLIDERRMKFCHEDVAATRGHSETGLPPDDVGLGPD